jgi:hypothetical protein
MTDVQSSRIDEIPEAERETGVLVASNAGDAPATVSGEPADLERHRRARPTGKSRSRDDPQARSSAGDEILPG